MGDGSAYVIVVVKHGEPGAHSVGHFPDQASIHSVLRQARQHIFPGTVGIHQGKEYRIEPQVAQVFRDIPADAAMDVTDLSGVAPAGDIGAGGVALDIHKDASNDYNTHVFLLFRPLYTERMTQQENRLFLSKAFFLSYHRKHMKNNRKTA